MPKSKEIDKLQNKKKSLTKRIIFEKSEFLYESNFGGLTRREEKDYQFLTERIAKDIENQESKIVAYLGPNGSGKSTILKYALEKGLKAYKVQPTIYEIWQYQDESKIWENFLITILSKNNSSKSKNKIARKIRNGSTRKWSIVFQVVLLILASCLSFSFIAIDLDGEKQYVNIGNLLFSIFSFGFLGFLLNQIHKTGSIEYIYQYENELLKRLIKKKGRPIVLIIEDIDRTKNGEIVIESLHAFINTNRSIIINPIIAICPMSRESFYGDRTMKKSERLIKTEISNKIYDYAINSSLVKQVIDDDIEKLLEAAGCRSEKIKPILQNVLAASRSDDGSLLNMRAIKFMLRDVNQFIERYPNLDEGIAILFASEKYISAKVASYSGGDDAIRMALLNRSGTATNSFNTSPEFSRLFGESFGVSELMEENKIPGSNFSIPLHFSYTRNDNQHTISIADDRRSINISLSGHYKELL